MPAKSIKLEIGTVYQKQTNGNYYFRYQINGRRKAVSLKTKNKKEALAKAKELSLIASGKTIEVIAAHTKHARDLSKKKQSLPLSSAWDTYSKHPNRARPTQQEHISYGYTFSEFLRFLQDPILSVDDITPKIAGDFSDYLRTTQISVSTHNRKVRRLKKIFEVLEEYRSSDNPFASKTLLRKSREDNESTIRRIAFTKEEEQKILTVLDDQSFRLINKQEIRVIFYIGMFTGQRLKDCTLLQWSNIDFNKRRIWVKQYKTGKEVSIPIAAELVSVLQQAKAWKKNNYVSPNVADRYNIIDKNGKNTGAGLVNLDVLRVIKKIGLETSIKVPGRKKKVVVYGFHSLRHSFASHCAEAGVPKAVVVSILGANSAIVDKHYTHIGNEAQEKAIQAISGGIREVTDRDRIDRALAFIENLESKSDVIKQIEEFLK